MFIDRTVSVESEQKTVEELTWISHNLLLFAVCDNLVFIHHSYILISHVIAEKIKISTIAKIINIVKSYGSHGKGYQISYLGPGG